MVLKWIRERLGLLPDTQVELVEVDGVLEVSPTMTDVRVVDRDGAHFLEADGHSHNGTGAHRHGVHPAVIAVGRSVVVADDICTRPVGEARTRRRQYG